MICRSFARALITTLLAVLALVIAGCGEEDEPKRVETADYSVTLPSGWHDETDRTDELTRETREKLGEKAGAFRIESAWVGPTSDGFRSNINVVRSPVRGLDLDALARASSAEVGRELGAQVSGTRSTTLGGDPARSYDYTTTQQGKRIKGRQVVAIRDGVPYVVSYSAADGAFDDDLPDAEKVLDSWRWK